MPTVTLRAPLKDLAGGHHELVVAGGTVGEVLRSLEGSWPKLTGWILDEHGHVRTHVNVFCNGDLVREDVAVADGHRLHVLPSITGGARPHA